MDEGTDALHTAKAQVEMAKEYGDSHSAQAMAWALIDIAVSLRRQSDRGYDRTLADATIPLSEDRG